MPLTEFRKDREFRRLFWAGKRRMVLRVKWDRSSERFMTTVGPWRRRRSRLRWRPLNRVLEEAFGFELVSGEQLQLKGGSDHV